MVEKHNLTSENYVNEIFSIADLVCDPFTPKDYNKIILPFTLLRRMECALEPTRDAVVKAYEENKAIWGIDNDNYCQYSKRPFYNVSSYRLNNLGRVAGFSFYDSLKI